MTAVEQVDVLICGSGSAGLCAAVWLARCGINYKILERRPGPLVNGQADGVQCRTVEVFESFGIAEDLLKEAYHVLEVAFWAAEGEGIKRTHYTADTEPGLSHQPHVILNQARVNGMLIQEMERVSGSAAIEYGCEVQSVEVDDTTHEDSEAYCVTTKANSGGKQRVFRSRYVLACDGAHSAVRRSLGFNMVGDSTNAVWGVMDLHARTDFPDIRKKAIIHSRAGNLMIIPREGDSMIRFYIELGSVSVKDVTLADLQERARRIFHPYSVEFMETIWWSAYSIGQRLADNFTKNGRVFLTGDACHTHSPKAGQGMNVSLQDGYNIGWKLAAVLRGQSSASILKTYVSERKKTAAQLIDFDRFFTKLFSSSYRQENGISSQDFKDQFVKAGRYTAGQGVQYEESIFVSPGQADKSLAGGVVVGMRFPSVQVVRFCDARPMQLVTALPADSRWHVVVFAGDILQQTAAARLAKVAIELQGIIDMFTPRGQDINTVIQGVLVLASKRTEVEQNMIPDVFTPVTGKWKIKHLQKVFVDDESYNAGHGQAYEAYGIHPEGCMIIVRPDQYVAKICSLDNAKDVLDFFSQFFVSTVQTS
ncbi:fad binding domain-containing [Trichoderma arundinaceum]|uniref:Fad binding domain-containing n=1 Tax=Trichoderma arundinaceum TaxID=490622 RepID=A0A395NEA9_TRIAR|nr:fad binding domain-containing [Trichoderma arundinaceum]